MIKVIGSCGKLAFFFLVFLVVKCKKKKKEEKFAPKKINFNFRLWSSEKEQKHMQIILTQFACKISNWILISLIQIYLLISSMIYAMNESLNDLFRGAKNTCTEFSSNNLQWKIVQIVKWSIVTDEIFNVTPQLLQKCRCHLPNCLRFIKWLEAAYVDVHERRWNEPLNLFLRFPYLLRARCTVVRVVNISLGFLFVLLNHFTLSWLTEVIRSYSFSSLLVRDVSIFFCYSCNFHFHGTAFKQLNFG